MSSLNNSFLAETPEPSSVSAISELTAGNVVPFTRSTENHPFSSTHSTEIEPFSKMPSALCSHIFSFLRLSGIARLSHINRLFKTMILQGKWTCHERMRLDHDPTWYWIKGREPDKEKATAIRKLYDFYLSCCENIEMCLIPEELDNTSFLRFQSLINNWKLKSVSIVIFKVDLQLSNICAVILNRSQSLPPLQSLIFSIDFANLAYIPNNINDLASRIEISLKIMADLPRNESYLGMGDLVTNSNVKRLTIASPSDRDYPNLPSFFEQLGKAANLDHLFIGIPMNNLKSLWAVLTGSGYSRLTALRVLTQKLKEDSPTQAPIDLGSVALTVLKELDVYLDWNQLDQFWTQRFVEQMHFPNLTHLNIVARGNPMFSTSVPSSHISLPPLTFPSLHEFSLSIHAEYINRIWNANCLERIRVDQINLSIYSENYSPRFWVKEHAATSLSQDSRSASKQYNNLRLKCDFRHEEELESLIAFVSAARNRPLINSVNFFSHHWSNLEYKGLPNLEAMQTYQKQWVEEKRRSKEEMERRGR